MGAHLTKDIVQRWPKPFFRSIEQLDRMRFMKLGLPVARTSGSTVPWGYRELDSEPGMFQPIEEDLRLLYKATELLRSCSYTEVAVWLSAKTGRSISANGLHKLLLERYPFPEILLDYDQRVELGRYTTTQTPKEAKSLPFVKGKIR